MATYLEPYNPRAYVPGGATYRVAKATQAKGKLFPVPKKKNPYVRPNPQGGSGAVSTANPSSPSSQAQGSNAQQEKIQNKVVPMTFTANYESDPVLARIKALGQQSVNNALTEAQALRKQAIIDTGFTDIGNEIGLDSGTLQAAASNPFSLKAQLAKDFETRGRDLDESLNQNNLFFSGYRANQLNELNQNQASAQYQAARDLRAALAGIDKGVLSAQEAAALQEQEAITEAAKAAQEQAYMDAFLNSLYGAGSEEVAATDPAATLTPDEELLLLLGGTRAGSPLLNYVG